MPSSMHRMVYVLATRLNVRTGPSTSNSIVNTVEIGSVLRVYGAQGSWIKISNLNDEWGYGGYVITVRMARVNATTLNVRSGPSTSFPRVLQLQNNQQVIVIETQNGWHKIGINDLWVSADFIELI
jgi:uncharacterized protein YgiM (DUF1202 family)